MKIVKNRFEQIIKDRGIETETRRQIPVALESFDKLADWAIAHGINEKQMFFNKVSDWARRARLPKVQALKPDAAKDKSYKNIEDMLRDVKLSKLQKNEKGAILKLNEDAYQAVMRWAVLQGATDKDEMAYLFSQVILKVTLPKPRKSADSDSDTANPEED